MTANLLRYSGKHIPPQRIHPFNWTLTHSIQLLQTLANNNTTKADTPMEFAYETNKFAINNLQGQTRSTKG